IKLLQAEYKPEEDKSYTELKDYEALTPEEQWNKIKPAPMAGGNVAIGATMPAMIPQKYKRPQEVFFSESEKKKNINDHINKLKSKSRTWKLEQGRGFSEAAKAVARKIAITKQQLTNTEKGKLTPQELAILPIYLSGLNPTKSTEAWGDYVGAVAGTSVQAVKDVLGSFEETGNQLFLGLAGVDDPEELYLRFKSKFKDKFDINKIDKLSMSDKGEIRDWITKQITGFTPAEIEQLPPSPLNQQFMIESQPKIDEIIKDLDIKLQTGKEFRDKERLEKRISQATRNLYDSSGFKGLTLSSIPIAADLAGAAATGLVGTAVGGPTGGAAGLFTYTSGRMYGDLVNEIIEAGGDPQEARAIGGAAMIPVAFLERIQVNKLVPQASFKEFSKQFIKAIKDRNLKEFGKGVALKSGALSKDFIDTYATEVGVEELQEIVLTAAKKASSEADFDDTELMNNLISTFKEAAKGMFLISAAGTGVRGLTGVKSDFNQINQAEAIEDTFAPLTTQEQDLAALEKLRREEYEAAEDKEAYLAEQDFTPREREFIGVAQDIRQEEIQQKVEQLDIKEAQELETPYTGVEALRAMTQRFEPYADIKEEADGLRITTKKGFDFAVKFNGDIGGDFGTSDPKLATINLSEKSGLPTFNHEFGHMIRDMGGITDKEWKSVVKIARESLGAEEVIKIIAKNKEGYEARGIKFTEDIKNHEIFANALEEWTLTGDVPVDARGTLQKFLDFIKDMLAQYIGGSQSGQKVISDIQSGKILERKPIGRSKQKMQRAAKRREEAQAALEKLEQIDLVDDTDKKFSIAPRTDSKAFKDWSGNGEIIEGYEIYDHDFKANEPVVMKLYHGTTHADKLFEFKGEELGNKEGHFGAINYFTNMEYDAEQNYLTEGPDLTQRIERRAEQLENEDMEEGEARKQAESELKGTSPEVLELYVRVDNPIVIGGDKETYVEILGEEDLSDFIDEAREQLAEDQGVDESELEDYEVEEAARDMYFENGYDIEQETPMMNAIESVSNEYDFDPNEVFEAIQDFYEGAKSGDIDAAFRNAQIWIEDPETGNLINSHVISQVYKELGYDAIILHDADQQFSTMDMPSNTTHVHIFDKDNAKIKSATENVGTYDPANPDIRYSLSPRSERDAVTVLANAIVTGKAKTLAQREQILKSYKIPLENQASIKERAFDIAEQVQSEIDSLENTQTIRNAIRKAEIKQFYDAERKAILEKGIEQGELLEMARARLKEDRKKLKEATKQQQEPLPKMDERVRSINDEMAMLKVVDDIVNDTRKKVFPKKEPKNWQRDPRILGTIRESVKSAGNYLLKNVAPGADKQKLKQQIKELSDKATYRGLRSASEKVLNNILDKASKTTRKEVQKKLKSTLKNYSSEPPARVEARKRTMEGQRHWFLYHGNKALKMGKEEFQREMKAAELEMTEHIDSDNPMADDFFLDAEIKYRAYMTFGGLGKKDASIPDIVSAQEYAEKVIADGKAFVEKLQEAHNEKYAETTQAIIDAVLAAKPYVKKVDDPSKISELFDFFKTMNVREQLESITEYGSDQEKSLLKKILDFNGTSKLKKKTRILEMNRKLEKIAQDLGIKNIETYSLDRSKLEKKFRKYSHEGRTDMSRANLMQLYMTFRQPDVIEMAARVNNDGELINPDLYKRLQQMPEIRKELTDQEMRLADAMGDLISEM
ncbi:MAG: hypothetical protein HRT70_06320, partial [Flavobacteriaceae bacterium]|nr:hypothetical protein [Flavobacteriaceae bacterium]